MKLCNHNAMIKRKGDLRQAWQCADCSYIYGMLDARAAAMERLQATARALALALPSEPSAQVIGKYIDDLNKGLDELKQYGV